ncbi:MAG: hypothetical protein WC884_03065 [Candidatus Paceibacterota bacterium]
MIKENENSDGAGKIVQTYAGDMAEVIENDTEGLVKKIIHGEEQHEAEKRNLSPLSKKNKILMFVSILLIIFALIIFFSFFKKNTNIVDVEKQFASLIFNDQNSFLEILGFKKEEIIQTVLNKINTTKVKVGGVEGIYLTENKQIIGLRRFITLIKSSFSPGDNTLFINDNFLMGVVLSGLKSTSPTAGDFFILLKARSTADIFDALRKWEDNLLSDLHGFLGINISSDTNYLFNKNFEDNIIENKNARVLYDKDGQLVVMYFFADDNSVVITNTQNSAHEIMLRLISNRNK